MFDFNNRARPESQALMSYITAGEIGTINSAQALWIRRCGIPGFGSWFTQKALAGGGSTIDLIHALDLALYFMGFPDPAWVLGQTFNDFHDNPDFKGKWGTSDVGTVDVETASFAFIMFKTGQVILARTSWAEMNRREEFSVTFQGTKGGGMTKRFFETDGDFASAFDFCEVYGVENRRQVNKKVLTSSTDKMGGERVVQNFVNSIAGVETPLSNPVEAVKLMKIVDAIYKSASSQLPVEIV